ncbi:MAG: hypothetical protein AB1468_04690 [Candidatus Micrarchaeota archaeon]
MWALGVKRTPSEQVAKKKSAFARLVKEPLVDTIEERWRRDLRERFITEMEGKGFVLLNKEGSEHYREYEKELNHVLDKKRHELLFKRKDGSNYFVFARDGKAGIEVHFTNPDTSLRAWELKRTQIVRKEVLRSADEMNAIVDEIATTAKNKDANALFTNTHSHLGSIPDGEQGEKKVHDDGISPLRDVIRNLLIANYDIDASGYHNWFDAGDFKTISRHMEAVGIRKLASVELTIPVIAKEKFGIRNGAHFMVYFKDVEAAVRFHEKYLKDRSQEIPGEASDRVWELGWEVMLKEMAELVEKGEISVGLAHPMGSLAKIKKDFVQCGALGQVALDNLELEKLVVLLKKLNIAVADFNLTVKPYPVEPVPKVFGIFRRWLEKAICAEAALTEVNLNYAFGEAMRKIGARIFAEIDKHFFHPMKYRSGVGALLRAITIIITAVPLEIGKITGEWFVNGMQKKDEGFSIDRVVFWAPVKKGKEVHMKMVPQRSNTFMENIDDFFASIREGLNGVYLYLKESVKTGWQKF